MEIGSFIELDFPKGKEFYNGTKDIARLNSGRAAIYHATRLLHCSTIYLPLYQCESVGEFLEKKNIKVKTYFQDDLYNPLVDHIEDSACILLVNYFGIMSHNRMKELAQSFQRVIIDNSQGFFAVPVQESMNVYSARKFLGVPDGAYVIGHNAEQMIEEYEQGYSSDTSSFLMQRIEYGCEGKTYQSRMLNEERLDHEDIKKMSALTYKILDGIDYETIVDKRKKNFEIASELFGSLNEMDPWMFYDSTCVPMVYPFVYQDDTLLERLLKGKHFQGNWWKYILSIADETSFEYKMSKYMIPITIDQRYGVEELKYVRSLI